MKTKTLLKKAHKTIRRSVVLPRQLINEASAVAPPELRQNLNRLVTVALQEFAAKRRERAFEQAIAQMAADPAIQAECAAITKDFTVILPEGHPALERQNRKTLRHLKATGEKTVTMRLKATKRKVSKIG